jgi:SAM-dependent methyltransferase
MVGRFLRRIKSTVRKRPKGPVHFAREVAPSRHMAQIYDWVLEASGADSNSHVFDEGCGAGMLYRRARERQGRKPFGSYLGVDSNQEVINEARKHGVDGAHMDYGGGVPDALRPEMLHGRFTHYYSLMPTIKDVNMSTNAAAKLLSRGGKFVVLAPHPKIGQVPENLGGGEFRLVKTEHRLPDRKLLKVLKEHEPLESTPWHEGLRLLVYTKVK